MMDIVSAAG